MGWAKKGGKIGNGVGIRFVLQGRRWIWETGLTESRFEKKIRLQSDDEWMAFSALVVADIRGVWR
jgi:hypothetical protein